MIRNTCSIRSLLAALGYLCGVFALSVCLLIPFAPQTRAATGINRQINYQGRLLDASGAAVADGNYSIKFSLYDAVSGGNRLWSATGTVATPVALTVSVSNGLFSVLLGDTSAGGGWQNALDNSIDWNSDSLFLGITVSSDSEMTPRRRFAAAPQAFNAENLQGMYASSSAFGGQSLFTIHQTSSTAATSTRTALEIRSEGTSSANDFLVRGVNDTGATVFSLNRAGNVTSSGYFAATGNGTSTISGNLSVTGNTTSTNLFTVNGILNNVTSTWLGFTTVSGTTGNINNLTSSNATISGGTINGTTIGATNASTGIFTNATATNVTTTWLGFSAASGTNENVFGLTWTNATGTNSTTTNLFVTNFISTNNTFTGVTTTWIGFTTASGTTGNIINLTSSNATISGGTINGTTIGATNASTGVFSQVTSTFASVSNITTSLTPWTNNSIDLGSPTLSWRNIYASGTIVGNLGSINTNNLTWTNATGTNTTTTWLGFTTASGTTLSVYSASSTNSTTTNFTVLSSITNQLSGASNFNTRSTTALPAPGDPNGVFVAGRYAYVANYTSSSLSVVDLSNPESPTVVASTFLGSGRRPTRVFVSGAYAYVVDAQATGGLNVVDISTPASSTLVGTSGALNTPTGVFVSGRYAYVSSNSDNTLYIMDISNPTNPFQVGSSSGGQAIQAVYVRGHYAYVAESGTTRVRAVDIKNPGIPISLGTFSLTVSPIDIFVQGRYAYVVSSQDGILRAIDITNPSVLTDGGTFTMSGTATSTSVFVSGRYAYVTLSDNTVRVIDVNVPATMSQTVSYSLPGTVGYAQGVFVSGRYLYASQAHGVNNLIVADVTGIDTNGLLAHTAEVGTLQVRGDATIGNQLRVDGGLNIGFGGIYSVGALSIVVTSTKPSSGGAAAAKFINTAATSTTSTNGQTWGVYTNTLLVGPTESATGTGNWVSVFTYTSGTQGALCIDATDIAGTCPVRTGLAVAAQGTIASNSFDLAESYDISGSASPGDVLVVDPTASSTAKLSPGIPYDPKLFGVVSTQPGFLLGTGGGTSVALVGRVPVKVSSINGPIHIGDALTSSPYPGVAMKATKPGMVLGRALQNASSTSTIEVFINVSYNAGSILTNDGSTAQITGDLVVAPTSTVSGANPTADSWGLTLRGSAWDGAQAVSSDFTLLTHVFNATSSQFSIRNSSTTVFSINQNGAAAVSGDLNVGGKLYPSARGVSQNSTYIFVDDSQGPTSTYIATNAAGWQSDSSYDFAERYYSPDKLESGDLVVISQRGQIHVQRALDEKQMLVGIVSTKPGFVAGRPATSTYPIALMGRVPTKVSTVKGAIHAGDSLAPSTIPGVAVKATTPGPIIGQALQDFSGADVGLVEVFVNPVWWGGDGVGVSGERLASSQTSSIVNTQISPSPSVNPTVTTKAYQGFALVVAGSNKVHVSFPSLQAYPNVQVTPRGEVDGGWWTDTYLDTGFDILLKQIQTHDVTFAWHVEATQPDEQVAISDGTFATVDPMTGMIVRGTQTTSTAPLIGSLPINASSTSGTVMIDSATSSPDVSATSTSTSTSTSTQP